MITLLTFDSVLRDQQDSKNMTVFRAAMADMLPDFTGGEFALFFENCEEMLMVSFDIRVSLYNVRSNENKDYLPVGEDMLPTLYMVMPAAAASSPQVQSP